MRTNACHRVNVTAVVVLGHGGEPAGIPTPPSLIAVVVTPSVAIVVVVSETDGAQGLILSWTTNLFAAGRTPDGDTETGPGVAGDVGEDEDAGGTASGLPKTHRRAQRIPLRQRGTL